MNYAKSKLQFSDMHSWIEFKNIWYDTDDEFFTIFE